MVVGASALFWTSRDYTVTAPEWDGQVRGIAYNPSHLFTDRQTRAVTPEQIDRDLAQLSRSPAISAPIRWMAAWTRCRRSPAAMA